MRKQLALQNLRAMRQDIAEGLLDTPEAIIERIKRLECAIDSEAFCRRDYQRTHGKSRRMPVLVRVAFATAKRVGA